MANYIPLARTALEPAVLVVGHVTCPCCDAPAELVDSRPLSPETAVSPGSSSKRAFCLIFSATQDTNSQSPMPKTMRREAPPVWSIWSAKRPMRR